MLPSDIESLCGSAGEEEDDNFRNLVGETLDILESDDCQTVLKMCLDAGFSHVMSSMIPFFQAEELGELDCIQGNLHCYTTLMLNHCKYIMQYFCKRWKESFNVPKTWI